MTETFPQYGLQNLILTKKGDRSMEALSRACGGNPTRANLQRLATMPMKAFPSNDVIIGLAKGLRVRAIDVVQAAAVSLGLPMPDPGSDLVLMDAGKLPAESQEVLHSVAENMLWWHEQQEVTQADLEKSQRNEDRLEKRLHRYQQMIHTDADGAENVHELFPEGRVAADSTGAQGDGGTIDPEQDPHTT